MILFLCMTKQVGIIKKKIISLLNLSTKANTPIFIGDSNIKHIQTKHPYEFNEYFDKIADIISYPDYVGINHHDNSIEYIKQYLINYETIKIAVRVTTGNQYYVRTMYKLNEAKVKRCLENNDFIKVD